MDIVLTARHCELSARFREQVREKLSRLERHDRVIDRVVVEVEPSRNSHAACACVQISVHAGRDSMRSEATAADKSAAFDAAFEKLLAQLRKAADRRRVHRGQHAPESVAHAMARVMRDVA